MFPFVKLCWTNELHLVFNMFVSGNIYPAKTEPMALLYISVSIVQARGMPARVTDQVKYLGWDSSCQENLSENDFKKDEPLTCPTSMVGTFLLLCMKQPW